jgi:hypothetical protein
VMNEALPIRLVVTNANLYLVVGQHTRSQRRSTCFDNLNSKNSQFDRSS